MIGILIVTHGGFAEGLKNAVELIAGNQEKFEAIGLHHGDSIETFYSNVKDTIYTLDDGDGVLVFVDILGGSPSNTVLKLLQEKEFKAICGVNMPMVCHAAMARFIEISVDELFEQCLENGKSSQISLNDVYKKMKNSADNEECVESDEEDF